MAHVAVCKAKDLETPARKAMQSLLGRQLGDEEKVTVMAFPPHGAPPRKSRRESAARLARVMDRAAAKVKDVPESELDAAIDEGMAHVRRRRP